MALSPTLRVTVLRVDPDSNPDVNPNLFFSTLASELEASLILPSQRRRCNGLFGLFRIVHRVACAFNGIVEVVLVSVDFDSIRGELLQNLQELLGLGGHQVDTRANILLLLNSELNQVRGIVHASDIRV